MFSDILGSIDVSVKIAVSNKVMTGGGTLSEDVGPGLIVIGCTGLLVLEGTGLLEETGGGPLFVLDEMTVGIPPGRTGGGNGGAPEEVLKGTQATPEGPTVMVEVTGVGRGTTVVEVWPLLVTVEITSV